jgi:hypothetical protein
MTATKECSSCGAHNDVIFTNCLFCKNSLPKVDENAITNEDLVMKASEWVGRSSELVLEIQNPNKNFWTGKGIVRMKQSEVIGNAEKYLNLLAIRATSNPTLSITYNGLKDKLDKNSKSSYRKYILKGVLGIVLPIVGFLGLFYIIGYEMDAEREAENRYQEKLEKVEIQINEALKDKNYNYALILIENLVWDYKLNYPENKKKAEAYDRKRKELKETVSTFKKESKNGNN